MRLVVVFHEQIYWNLQFRQNKMTLFSVLPLKKSVKPRI